MSFDLMLFKLPPANDLDAAPHLPMGSPRDIRQIISKAFPEAVWNGSADAVCRAQEFVMQISLGSREGRDAYIKAHDELKERLLRENRDPTLEELEKGLRTKLVETSIVDSISFHFRGGRIPFASLIALCKQNDWRLHDCQEGAFVNLEDIRELQEGWEGWRQFQNRIVNE